MTSNKKASSEKAGNKETSEPKNTGSTAEDAKTVEDAKTAENAKTAKDAKPAKDTTKVAADKTAEQPSMDEIAAELAAESEAQVPADSAAHSASDAEQEGSHLTVVPTEALSAEHVRNVIEAALFAADEALTVDRLVKLFVPGELEEEGGRAQVRDALNELAKACEDRGFELKKVASGYRMQVRQTLSPWVSRLWEEKPPRYTRALLETMALIAYKQPATRGDIEEVRGVAVSSNIMRTLLERGWIREVGQRDVPGRPSMYGTTKEFLDYFNLSSLDELPSLPELRELVEPAPIAEEVAEQHAEQTADVEAQAEGAAEETSQELGNDSADAQADTATPSLTGVDTEVAADVKTNAETTKEPGATAGAVFADDEVVVVSEEVSAQVQHSSELSTLPTAEHQE